MKIRGSYIVNINYAHQAEFTESKSSHTGIELMHRPSKMLRQCPVDYKVPLSGSYYTVAHHTQGEGKGFPYS